MPLLRYKHNFAHIQLDTNIGGDSVSVRMKDGETRFLKWRGFLDVELANANNYTPVKLVVDEFSNSDAFAPDASLEISECILGCHVPGVGV